MKFSRIIFYAGIATFGVTSALAWQQSKATALRQRRVVSSAMIQPAAIAATAAPSPIQATAAPSAQSAAPAPASTASPAVAAAPRQPLITPAPADQSEQIDILTIKSCNRTPGNANFRSAPDPDPRTVVGVVRQSDPVQLTGRTAGEPDNLWYEAIALTPLFASAHDLAANTKVGQRGLRGWLSGCFVKGEAW
jgi:uncharacterized membrane protein